MRPNLDVKVKNFKGCGRHGELVPLEKYFVIASNGKIHSAMLAILK